MNINENEFDIRYSPRRPRSHAWRVASGQHITYAHTRELAVALHKAKLRCDTELHWRAELRLPDGEGGCILRSGEWDDASSGRQVLRELTSRLLY